MRNPSTMEPAPQLAAVYRTLLLPEEHLAAYTSIQGQYGDIVELKEPDKLHAHLATGMELRQAGIRAGLDGDALESRVTNNMSPNFWDELRDVQTFTLGALYTGSLALVLARRGRLTSERLRVCEILGIPINIYDPRVILGAVKDQSRVDRVINGLGRILEPKVNFGPGKTKVINSRKV